MGNFTFKHYMISTVRELASALFVIFSILKYAINQCIISFCANHFTSLNQTFLSREYLYGNVDKSSLYHTKSVIIDGIYNIK